MSDTFIHTVNEYHKLNRDALGGTYDAVAVVAYEPVNLDEITTCFKGALDSVVESLKSLDIKKPGTYSKPVIADDQIVTAFMTTLAQNTSVHDLHKALRTLFSKIKAGEVKRLAVVVDPQMSAHEIGQSIKRFALESDSFNHYKTSGVSADLSTEAPKPFRLEQLDFYVESDVYANKETIEESVVLAEAIINARHMVNEPACIITPSVLADMAVNLGKTHGFEVEVHGPDWIQEKGLDAYWAVAKGSDEEPRFIVMRIMNNPASDKKLGYIGKGMCYDSGGYAIKPAAGMNTMQTDMAGSAAVINAMAALARTKAPVNVVAVVAACENMISGHAYRNGDIISSYAGKFIEVDNTDAEGRLTLADAMTYAYKDEKATKLIDIATLTGAVIVALGYHYTAALTDDEELWNNIVKAQESCGDKVWRLPVDDEYAKQNESKFADIKNAGGRDAGTITAGHFLRSFAGKTPFMHLDIAATSWMDSANDYNPYGGTGVGTELLYRLAINEFTE